jgi:hypothetical protein
MRRWKPQTSALLWVAIVALVLAVGVAGYLLMRLGAVLVGPPGEWPIDSRLFGLFLACLAALALAGALAYRVAAALTLAYSLDRNGLYISWLGNRAVVPLQQVESVESGVRAPARPVDLLRSVGYYHGRVRLPEGRVLHRFSTRPLGRALVIHTSADSYAISPQDADGFVQNLEQLRGIGAVQPLAPVVEAGRAFTYAFWVDQVVRRSLALALLLNLALLGVLMTIFPGLPPEVALRPDATGAAMGLVPRHQILFLPLAGAAVALLNIGLGLTFYRREPAGARLLQIASVGVQALFAVAALTILR